MLFWANVAKTNVSTLIFIIIKSARTLIYNCCSYKCFLDGMSRHRWENSFSCIEFDEKADERKKRWKGNEGLNQGTLTEGEDSVRLTSLH